MGTRRAVQSISVEIAELIAACDEAFVVSAECSAHLAEVRNDPTAARCLLAALDLGDACFALTHLLLRFDAADPAMVSTIVRAGRKAAAECAEACERALHATQDAFECAAAARGCEYACSRLLAMLALIEAPQRPTLRLVPALN